MLSSLVTHIGILFFSYGYGYGYPGYNTSLYGKGTGYYGGSYRAGAGLYGRGYGYGYGYGGFANQEAIKGIKSLDELEAEGF